MDAKRVMLTSTAAGTAHATPPSSVRVGVTGFGRMGRLVSRVLLLRGAQVGLQLVHVNEIKCGADMAAYLLEFDSTHGRFPLSCDSTTDANGNGEIVVDKTHRITYTRVDTPRAIPWDASGVDIVMECTGAFLTVEKLQGHFEQRSVKKVIVSAPVDDADVLNVVVGCNDALLRPDMRIVTAASCTTNCAAPVIGALDAAFGIEMGSISTVHDVTPTQTLTDLANPGKKNDLRRARSGAVNLAPTTTGSAKAVALIFPHLKGKLDGLAIRVPCQNASITDLCVVVKRDVTKEDVNAALKAASDTQPLVLGFETKPLVSTDYVNDARSSIVDAPSTQVINKRMVKVLAWYDNEWGYVNRMFDLAVALRRFVVSS